MDISIQEMADKLRQHRAYRIFYHISPDGDAIGSAYALSLALRSFGCKTAAVCESPVPPVYAPLCAAVPNDTLEDALQIVVDSTSPVRIGCYKEEHIDFCIDHHEQNAFNSAWRYVDENASSCSQLVLRVIQAMQVPVTKQMADFLYTGLLTDTNCFRSYNTNVDSLETAAELARLGADVVGIARRHFIKKTPARMALEQRFINSFRLKADNRLIGSMIRYRDLQETGVTKDELEGIPSLPDRVIGPEISIVVRETEPQLCRVSVRTSPPYRADEICRAFGGNGHSHAAGIQDLHGDAADILEKIENHCLKILNDQ